MQVGGLVHVGGKHWAASCSALTGASWHGGLSVFKCQDNDSFHPTHQWLNSNGGVTSVCSIRGTALVSGCMSGEVSLHPYSEGFLFADKKAVTSTVHQGPVTCVSGHPTESSFLSASYDNKINYYHVKDGDINVVNSVLAHYMPILCLTWNTDSTFLSGGRDAHIKLWDVREGGEGEKGIGGRPALSINAQRRESYALAVRDSTVAVGEEDGIAFYDLRGSQDALKRLTKFRAPVKALAIKGHHLAVGADDGQTLVVDLNNDFQTLYSSTHTDFVRCVAWNSEADGEYASGGWGQLEDGLLDVKLHKLK